MAPPTRPIIVLPNGLKIAGMRARLGAWVIDSIVFGALWMAFWMVAVSLGVITVSAEAESQIENSPLATPTSTPYQANLPVLAISLAILVLVCVAYATVFWARFRGLPGQRLLSLQVGDSKTGKNLSLRRSFIRAAVAVGIPMAAGAAFIFANFAMVASVPWSQIVQAQTTGSADGRLSAWLTLLLALMGGAIGWPLVLLMWTATSTTRQGLHDNLAGSLVVGVGSPWRAGAAGLPGYGPGYGSGYGQGYGQNNEPGFLPGYGPGYWMPPVQATGPSMPAPDRPGGDEGRPAGVGDGGAPGGQPQAGGPSDPQWQPPHLQGQGPGQWPGGWSPPDLTPPPGSGNLENRPAWTISDGDPDSPPRLHAASIGRRVAGYLFDCVVVYMGFELVGRLLIVAFLPTDVTTIDERTFILIGLVAGFLQLAYFTASWAVWQGTLGQRIMHMRIGDAKTGKALGWMDAVTRWAVLQGPFALATIVPEAARIPVMLAASSWALYLLYSTINDPDSRGLHDRFLNSRVALEP